MRLHYLLAKEGDCDIVVGSVRDGICGNDCLSRERCVTTRKSIVTISKRCLTIDPSIFPAVSESISDYTNSFSQICTKK